MIKLLNSSSQKQNYGLQTIQDYKLHKTTMDKFEHKIKSKDILRSKSIFIYLRLNKYDRKSDFLNKFSLPYSSFNLKKKKAEQSKDINSRDSDIHHYSNKIENVILETIRSYVQPPT